MKKERNIKVIIFIVFNLVVIAFYKFSVTDKLNESLIRRFAEERSTTNLQIMSYFDTCRIIHLFIFFLNGEVAFSLGCKREFQLGTWNETDKRNSQGKEIIKAIE